MKIEDFVNLTNLLTFGLKNNRLLAYDELYQVVKFREDPNLDVDTIIISF